MLIGMASTWPSCTSKGIEISAGGMQGLSEFDSAKEDHSKVLNVISDSSVFATMATCFSQLGVSNKINVSEIKFLCCNCVYGYPP